MILAIGWQQISYMIITTPFIEVVIIQNYLDIMRVTLLLSALRQHGATFLMILENIATLSVDIDACASMQM